MRAAPEQHSAILGPCTRCDHWFAYTGPAPSNGVTGEVRSEISLG